MIEHVGWCTQATQFHPHSRHGNETGIQTTAIFREQQAVTRLYLIACAFSLPVAVLLINFSGLAGAVVASVVLMAMLLVLLLSEYLVLRKRAETAY